MLDKFWVMPRLTQLELLEKYHELFTFVVEEPRIMPKGIAKKIGFSGQGKARTTIMYHLENMYEKKISMKPQICLKSFKETQTTAYFCKRKANRGLFAMFKNLDRDPKINYAMCLSSSDFFLTSRDEDLHVKKYGLTVEEKSKLFTPQYPLPRNWKCDIDTADRAFLNTTFKKGKIRRELYNGLDWDKLDWRIYDLIRGNIREKFTVIAEGANTTSKTVKDHFFRRILPHCMQINYFFPKGYGNYLKTFIKIDSEFENSIGEGLRSLSSTNYLFPLERNIVIVLFHESIVKTLRLLEKMEEMAIIDGYLLYSVLASTG